MKRSNLRSFSAVQLTMVVESEFCVCNSEYYRAPTVSSRTPCSTSLNIAGTDLVHAMFTSFKQVTRHEVNSGVCVFKRGSMLTISRHWMIHLIMQMLIKLYFSDASLPSFP